MKEDNLEQKQAQKRRESDRAFIQNSENWPRWPALPVKRRDGNHHETNSFGTIMAGECLRVYATNVFRLAAMEPRPVTWGDALRGVPFEDFSSLDQLLDKYTVD